MCKGDCRESITCNHVTDQCDNGCVAGWIGCEKGKIVLVNHYCELRFFLFNLWSLISSNILVFSTVNN